MKKDEGLWGSYDARSSGGALSKISVGRKKVYQEKKGPLHCPVGRRVLRDPFVCPSDECDSLRLPPPLVFSFSRSRLLVNLSLAPVSQAIRSRIRRCPHPAILCPFTTCLCPSLASTRTVPSQPAAHICTAPDSDQRYGALICLLLPSILSSRLHSFASPLASYQHCTQNLEARDRQKAGPLCVSHLHHPVLDPNYHILGRD